MALDPMKWLDIRTPLTIKPFIESIDDYPTTSTLIRYPINNIGRTTTPIWHSFLTEGLHHRQTWSVYFFFNGVDVFSKGFLSVYLVLDAKSSDYPVQSRSTLKLYSDPAKKCFQVINYFQMEVGDICGAKKWKAIDQSTTSFELIVILNERVIMENEPDHTTLLFGTPGDVILVGTDWKYTCHKHVLSKFSPVFSAMFQHNMKEIKMRIVNIEEIEAPVMRSLLSYLYTGKAVNLSNTVHKLLIASDQYDIEKLKVYCQDYLMKHLSFDNIVESLLTADQCKLDALKTECLNLLHRMPDQIKETNSWKLLEERDSLLCDSINNLLLNDLI